MARKLERLISTSDLKTSRLEALVRDRKLNPSISYDEVFDALILRFVPELNTVVHYIDDEHIALLYEESTKEIVGLQIEDFTFSFLPHHANVERVWRLSDVNPTFSNMGDLILAVERIKPTVAREIFKATETPLREHGVKLPPVYA